MTVRRLGQELTTLELAEWRAYYAVIVDANVRAHEENKIIAEDLW